MMHEVSLYDTGDSRSELQIVLPAIYSRVLEIGCNRGAFRKNLTLPHEYWGVEPFQEAADVAKTRLDRVLIGLYDQVENQIPDKYFDLVIANDVIEHMENPWRFLNSIKHKMSDNASLVCSIPNVRFIWNLKELLVEGDWRYADTGILDRTHLRFFTKKSIVRIFDECNFRIEKIVGLNAVKLNWKARIFLAMLRSLGQCDDCKFLQFGVLSKLQPKET
jgi:2-polyprenyl-3-methyl-5-hydroxy-6-metoxy-1,4-benzoquinol methylase